MALTYEVEPHPCPKHPTGMPARSFGGHVPKDHIGKCTRCLFTKYCIGKWEKGELPEFWWPVVLDAGVDPKTGQLGLL